MKFFYLIIIIFTFASCEKKTDSSVANSSTQIDLRESLKSKIFKDGDEQAYMELRIAYLDRPSEDFLFWALLMANKHDFAPAYFDVFVTLKNACGSDASDYSLKELDPVTKELAISYLRKAAEKGNAQAKEALSDNSNSYEK